MKRFFCVFLLALAALGSQANWAAADDASAKAAKPVAMFSLAGYDAFKGDINYLGKLANQPELGNNLEGVLKLFTKNQGLAGVDKTRPWGAIVQTDGETFSATASSPSPTPPSWPTSSSRSSTSPKTWATASARSPARGRAQPLFTKELKGWLFLADKPGNLVDLPDDPAALLGGLEKQYQIGLRLIAGNVPEKFREMFVAEMKNSAQRDAAIKRPGESDDECAYARK